ncbi:C-type lectin domain family 4 member A isoform X1 [Phacochoerus africanus]|uniref:C-type lectin domain family 4 member A isoform X1 n=1 Tax=Phacochoerus africanus TaxID=41426 RepID=UPI001FDAA011|nr:C-type lectin domain family 4 member A isoform X1 [Phacochoerus africanus]XP_047643569.1 C-type lectin domain family 4 member A isoform X1 [Phacochoerus africanus]
MNSEITYAEVRFKNEPTSSGTKSEPPTAPKEKTNPQKCDPSFPKLLASLLILLLLLTISFLIAFIFFFQKYSHIYKEKKTLKEVPHTALECMKENLTMEDKDWSCCPKNWTSFSSNCYFISAKSGTWDESEKKCSSMKTHLLVITTKAEQDFIIQKLVKNTAYYVGLSDLQGKNNWQWVDQTPYNESVTFWHSGEPNDHSEHCVILHFRTSSGKWGWNDVRCNEHQKFICKMMKIYL